MKRKYSYFDGKKQTGREYSYIPFRYILAVFIALLEVLAVICTDYTCCRLYAILYVQFPCAFFLSTQMESSEFLIVFHLFEYSFIFC